MEPATGVPMGVFLCQDRALYPSREGDSGSPVFTPLFGTRFVILAGINTAVHIELRHPERTYQKFSPIGGVQRDLGTLTVCTRLFDDVSIC
jgi:hypothetical protein